MHSTIALRLARHIKRRGSYDIAEDAQDELPLVLHVEEESGESKAGNEEGFKEEEKERPAMKEPTMHSKGFLLPGGLVRRGVHLSPAFWLEFYTAFLHLGGPRGEVIT